MIDFNSLLMDESIVHITKKILEQFTKPSYFELYYKQIPELRLCSLFPVTHHIKVRYEPVESNEPVKIIRVQRVNNIKLPADL